MTISQANKEKLNWLILEGVVVVVSILLAFWIDASWDERQERRLEHTYLVAMREDVRQTIEENERVRSLQSKLVEEARATLALILSDARLSDDIRTSFLVISLPAESMDTYRDLVSSGNTTIISNPDVRSAMANLLQRIEYNDRAENWALGLQTSLRNTVLASAPDAMSREHLAEFWQIYVDAGERVLEGKERLGTAGQAALAILDQEIEGVEQ